MSRSSPQSRDLATVEFVSSPVELRRVRDVVSRAARECACPAGAARDMVIAVDEACQNVMRHAYAGRPDGKIRLEIRRLDDGLEFVVADWGARVDTSRIRPRELGDLRPGGLGTRFMRECMDECVFLEWSEETGNRLRMRKCFEPEKG